MKSFIGCPVNSALLCKSLSRSFLSLSAPTRRNAFITSLPPDTKKSVIERERERKRERPREKVTDREKVREKVTDREKSE